MLLSGCIRINTTSYEGTDIENSNSDFKATVQRNQKEAVPSSILNLLVDNQFGPVVVVGVDANFGWEWNLKCQAKDEARANEYADKCHLDAKVDGNTLELTFVRPKESGFRVRTPSITSDLQVRVPKSVQVDLKNKFGSAEITEIKGSVKAKNQSGRITLKSLPGEVDASTSFASMSALDIGPANLRNQSGSIDIERVSGDLVAHTSFASMNVRNIKGTTTLENQSGSIKATDIEGTIKAHTSFASLKIENAGPANLSNQSGSIEANRVGGDVDAKTSFAHLSVNHIQGRATLSNQSGEIVATEIAGDIKADTSFGRMKLSGQGENIHARNQSGSIEIAVPSSKTARIDAATSFSSIQLWLPENAVPLITAETSFGKVKSDFPVIMKDTMSVEKMNADASSPKVVLKNQSGDIRISKQDMHPKS